MKNQTSVNSIINNDFRCNQLIPGLFKKKTRKKRNTRKKTIYFALYSQ